MAATYSSFMTTRFYSPVFNTALFDGPFRIYFSQSYESSALKIYHLLQTEYQSLWQDVKNWSLKNKEHVFLLIYPDSPTVQTIFGKAPALTKDNEIYMQDWEEGLAFGFTQPTQDNDLSDQLAFIHKNLTTWLQEQNSLDLENVPAEL